MAKDLIENKGLPSLPDPAKLKEIFDSFEGITPSFQTIKVPTGGGLVWMVPGDEEEPEPMKEIIATIIDRYKARAYWPEEFGGGNQPPTCSSLDAKHGTIPRNEAGEFGDCATCTHAQWGSGKGGRGQGCKVIQRCFIMLDGQQSIFPYLLPLPPTSGEGKFEGSLSTYSIKIAGKMKRLWDVKTKIKLVEDKNKEGIKFSKALFFFVTDLSEPEKKHVAVLRQFLGPIMRQKEFEAEEMQHEEEKTIDPWDK